ncbi:MAG TPA: HypC/HybG/HupF family hydrogenase formation chaperone [Rhodocyclaceae bacterium]|nr:HypC/HybG/HupF family hydrogenase formation chaperone [Rhodocyclaceae bacterium]
MCLAIPALVVRRLEAEEALIDAGGIEKRVSLALVPEAAVGDYVVVHAGYAISRVDPEEALLTLALFAEMQRDMPEAAA